MHVTSTTYFLVTVKNSNGSYHRMERLQSSRPWACILSDVPRTARNPHRIRRSRWYQALCLLGVWILWRLGEQLGVRIADHLERTNSLVYYSFIHRLGLQYEVDVEGIFILHFLMRRFFSAGNYFILYCIIQN